jgi:glycyl-tRNA synthetase (class II)
MVDCRNCKKRHRADQLCEEQGRKLIVEGKTMRIRPRRVVCSACGSKNLTEPKAFNLMFKTYVGPVEDEGAAAYLRPETAQAIFVQFGNVASSTRQCRCPSASRSPARASATRSTPATTPSARASSSRWNWNSSSGPTRPSN